MFSHACNYYRCNLDLNVESVKRNKRVFVSYRFSFGIFTYIYSNCFLASSRTNVAFVRFTELFFKFHLFGLTVSFYRVKLKIIINFSRAANQTLLFDCYVDSLFPSSRWIHVDCIISIHFFFVRILFSFILQWEIDIIYMYEQLIYANCWDIHRADTKQSSLDFLDQLMAIMVTTTTRLLIQLIRKCEFGQLKMFNWWQNG